MKYKVLVPFVDKNTKMVYGKNEVIDLTEKRVKEIISKNKELIEEIKETKEEIVEETENKEEVEEAEEVKETKEEK